MCTHSYVWVCTVACCRHALEPGSSKAQPGAIFFPQSSEYHHTLQALHNHGIFIDPGIGARQAERTCAAPYRDRSRVQGHGGQNQAHCGETRSVSWACAQLLTFSVQPVCWAVSRVKTCSTRVQLKSPPGWLPLRNGWWTELRVSRSKNRPVSRTASRTRFTRTAVCTGAWTKS